MALRGGRKHEVFHSDEVCQFTSSDFVDHLQTERPRSACRAEGACYDNIMVERLWRAVKHEEVYQRA